jgi:hypothetical protein
MLNFLRAKNGNIGAQPPSEFLDQMEANMTSLRDSLKSVLDLLAPQLSDHKYDDAMILLGMSPTEFIEPLNRFEVIVLAAALYTRNKGNPFSYTDILELTKRFAGREMNTTMVYKTIEALIGRGLMIQGGKEVNEETGRPARVFSINEFGEQAFRMAILNAAVIKEAIRNNAA